MNKSNHLEKERKQDRAAVPTEFQTSTKKNTKKTGVLGVSSVSTATDISLFCKSKKIKKTWGAGGGVEGNGGEILLFWKGRPVVQILQKHWDWIDTSAAGSILWSSLFSGRQLARFIQTLLLSHQPLRTWLLLTGDVAMRSHDSLRAAVRETQALLTTDPVTDRGRVKVKHSLELFYCTKQNRCFLLHQSKSAAFIGKKYR